MGTLVPVLLHSLILVVRTDHQGPLYLVIEWRNAFYSNASLYNNLLPHRGAPNVLEHPLEERQDVLQVFLVG